MERDANLLKIALNNIHKNRFLIHTNDIAFMLIAESLIGIQQNNRSISFINLMVQGSRGE